MCPHPDPETCEYITLHVQGLFELIELRILYWGIILDYSDGPKG